jgi:hypothetical protein
VLVVQRSFRCPPEAVLAVLADGWAYVAWVVGASRIRGVDPAWPAPGARIAHSVGAWPLLTDDVTICESWDPEVGRLGLTARGWPLGEAQVRLQVRPAPGGCVVRMAEDASRGPGTLVPGPVRRAVLRPRNLESLRRLAALAERPGVDAVG